ncbi:MAG: DEAD/DEAH box helicase [Prevotella sp.]|nr:DEAD/DEAH box helicase [Prevotella sp.]
MGNIERILTKLHINELNDMQNDAFDAILHTDNDVIILSPTGSGKTLAYLLPVSQLADAQSDNVQVLVIVPGRELALQSDTVLKNMGSGLRSCGCYGGRPAMEEHKTLKQVKPQVIFGTPGRLNDHIDKENISPYGIRYVIIDEFDKCLEMGFHDEMARLMNKLPGVRRRILLSATDAEQIPNFVRLARAEKLDYLIEEEQVTERIRLYEVNSPSKDKLDTLNQLLRSFGDSSSIVFLNYRDSVERTADYLRRSGFSASHFHGGMEQKLREDALYKFSNGSSNIFVSTDLASRGLDIPDIDNIVHYHLPQSEDGYIHRVGRTARWESEGRAFFLLGPDEYIPEFVEGDVETFDIPDNLPQPAQPKMATIYIGKGKKDKISKGDIVGYLCKKGGLEPNEIGRIDVKDRYTYAAVMRQKVSQVLKMTRGEKIKGIKTIVEIVK